MALRNQLFGIVSWAVYPVKIDPQNDLLCFGWDIKPYSLTHSCQKYRKRNLLLRPLAAGRRTKDGSVYVLLFIGRVAAFSVYFSYFFSILLFSCSIDR